MHLPLFVIAWGMFTLAATTSFIIQACSRTGRFSPRALFLEHFPLESWLKPSARMDMIIFAIARLIFKIPFGLAWTLLSATFVTKLLTHIAPHHQVYHADYLVLAICCLVIFLVSDFTHYFTHYMQHFVPMLWEFHKVHHSATFLNPLTAEREHPLAKSFDSISNAILIGCTAGGVCFVCGFSLIEISLLTATINKIACIIVPNSLKHSHFPIHYGVFDCILVSPRMHQIHHSSKLEHWDKNFGDFFSIWDICFGTRYRARPNETITLGLGTAEEVEHEKLWGVYVGPFIKTGRLIGAQRSRFKPGRAQLTDGIFRRRRINDEPLAPLILNQPEAEMNSG